MPASTKIRLILALRNRESSYDNTPFHLAPPPVHSQATRRCISLVSRHLRVEHVCGFCGVISSPVALQSAVGILSVFLSREGECKLPNRGVPHASQQISRSSSYSLSSHLVPGFLQRSTKYMQGQLQCRRNSHREFDSCLAYAFGQPFYPFLPGHHHTNYTYSYDWDCL